MYKEHGNGYYSENGAGAKRIERYQARNGATESIRAKAFRLIEYAHNARLNGDKRMARHWLEIHKFWRDNGVRDGFI